LLVKILGFSSPKVGRVRAARGKTINPARGILLDAIDNNSHAFDQLSTLTPIGAKTE